MPPGKARRRGIADEAQRAAITKEKLTEMAHKVYLKAMEAGQFSAAIGAVREIGILTGLRVERRENGAPSQR
jgi:hypothetical protein